MVQDLGKGRRKALSMLLVVTDRESPVPTSKGSGSAKGSDRIKT